MALSLTALALVALNSGVANAQDDEKAKRFSISFSGGIRPDMANLGTTILQDGTVDVADTSFASVAYSTDQVFMSDRDNMTLAANSQATDSVFNVLSDYQAGGSMLGLELGGDIRYELDDLINFPIYVESGLYHVGKMSGGEQSRTLGDIANQSETIQLLAALYGLDTNDYSGGKMTTTWNAAWWEIPISVGVKVPVTHNPHSFAYGSVGMSIFSGGFDVGFNIDEKYANVLATHIDQSTSVPVVTNLSPGAVQDNIKFRSTSVGLNYGLGAQVGLKKHLAFFVELNSSGAADTVYSEGLSDKSKQLLTAVSSQSLAESDPMWFDRIAYPVVMTGGSARAGIRAYLF